MNPLEALHMLNVLMSLGPEATRALICELDHRELMAIAHGDCTIIIRNPDKHTGEHQPMQIAG